jgi:DNA replication protein DnaC
MTGEQEKNTTETLLEHCGVNKRFQDVSIGSFVPVNPQAQECLTICQQFTTDWPQMQAAGSNLLMSGRPGTGKTHLAVGIMRELVEHYDADVYLTSAQRMIRAMRDTWRQDATRTEYEVLGFYCGLDLLIIDEVGMQNGTDSERLIVSEIINTRYEQMKPTVLISNFTAKQLEDFMGYRAMDRILESAAVLAFDWESQRGRL